VGKYLIAHIVSAIPTILGVTALVFLMVRLVPGDPIEMMLARSGARQGTEEKRAALHAKFGLDKPIHEQFAVYVGNLAHGDLGQSIINDRSVFAEITNRLPNTLRLAAFSFAISTSFGIVAGVLAATHKNTVIDLLSMALAVVFVSMPSFWLGLMAILVFSLWLGWLPVSGSETWRHLVLPAAVLGVRSAAILARITRSTMLEVLNQDFVRTARAKGLREHWVVNRHALRNALIPIVTVLGFEIGGLLSGAFIIETVFAYPGIGQLAIQSIATRDFPMIQGTILFVALVYVAINLMMDVFYAMLDPRIRHS
jgi:peptide/nickel transport system permease protein/oligopeptide transport system permease protein